jgi:sugar phosphate isomerase/epimerase
MSKRPSLLDRLAISGTEYPYRPLEEFLNVARQLEVPNLELWIPHNFEFKDLAGVERELSRRGLSAVAISTWTQLNLPGDVRRRQELIGQSIEAAKALGAPTVNTYFGSNPTRTAEESVLAYREAIMPLVERAGKEGVVITLENEFEASGRDVTRRATEVVKILEAVHAPSFKITFDPCNFYFAGEEPYPFAYELLKDHVGYVHLKDGMKYDSRLHAYPGEGFLWKDHSGEYICCPMGVGAINYTPLLQRLADGAYTGYLTLEPHVPPPLRLSTFQQSLQFVRQILSRKE